MKKIVLFVAALAFFVSCEEFQPVFTGKYKNPGEYEIVDDSDCQPIKKIQELKDMYKTLGKGDEITDAFYIKGQVISSDRSGNVYKSIYIQDETGGIEVKLGKNGLYNDYKLGQWVYVDCQDLHIGQYNGMPQLGFIDPTGEYETSYLEADLLINSHVLRGEMGTPIPPKELTSLPAVTSAEGKKLLGTYVELKGLKYANGQFVLVYVNPNLRGDAKKAPSNRIFFGDDYGKPVDWGITTWAMSKEKCIYYLGTEKWQNNDNQDGSFKLSSKWDPNKDETENELKPTAYSVSQYFTLGSTSVQVRTSGYCRFSDTELPPEVRDGSKTINLKGILTVYNGSYQFTIIDLTNDNMTIN